MRLRSPMMRPSRILFLAWSKSCIRQTKISQYDATYFGGFDRYSIEKDWRETAGTLLFIGIFLSVIFLLATVLVIYYKQISEGHEDRDNFVILQQVGLDQKQTGTTIRKQILTVFFLPLFFSFLYLGVAYKMIAKIVAILGATNTGLVLKQLFPSALSFSSLMFSSFFWLLEVIGRLSWDSVRVYKRLEIRWNITTFC